MPEPGPDAVSPVPEYMSGWLMAISRTASADPGKQRHVRELKAALNKLKKDRRDAARAERTDLESQGLRGEEARARRKLALANWDRKIDETERKLTVASDELADGLGNGIAHLGDVIGVPVELFRRRAVDAVRRWMASRAFPATSVPCTDDPELVAEALAAQASDGILEGGRVVPTPYSFGNGASGQCLLKDFRACARACSPQAVEASIAGGGSPRDDLSGLNWDPAEQRSYALQWRNPEDGKEVDPVPNALAFVGLTMLPLAPGSRGRAVGWRVDGSDQAFTWPLWGPALEIRAVRGLLAGSAWRRDGRDLALLARYGIHEVRESARINPTGKRPFFAPSRAV